MSESNSSVKTAEETTSSNTTASAESKRLHADSSSQDMYLEKSDGGVRIFVDYNYYDYKVRINNLEMDYGAFSYALQDIVSDEGDRYILFSYYSISCGRGNGRSYYYLLLGVMNNHLIPLWTDEDIIFKTSYADNIFTVKIGDYPEEYKIDISSKVEYEDKESEKFKPQSVADILNGSSLAICEDVHIDSKNQIVMDFYCANADYMFYITSIKLVWSLKSGEVQLEQCSLVNEYPG